LALEDSGYQATDPALSFKALTRRAMGVAADDVADLMLVQRLKAGVSNLRAAAESVASHGN
jgi:hypothetical protein